MPLNEEHVKNQIILPWLLEAGVDISELYFETSFAVHLGRQSIRVGDGKETRTARGRLDILVTRENRNLLVIEVKSEDHKLTDDDRDQAISYARIVNPIAPYALVTNGHSFHLFQTQDKLRIEPSAIELSGMELSFPEEDIAEAQTLFLRLSSSNLMKFCTQVCEKGMQHLKGPVELQKKYVPGLHVTRNDVDLKVHQFLETTEKALILTGPSGMGKSCELCSIAERFMSVNQPVLFLNGSLLESGILEAIAAEFEWQFNAEISPTRILRRIERFANARGLVILVDAIDEWTNEHRAAQLANLIRSIDGSKIKLIFTCKDYSIETLTSVRGESTLAEPSVQILHLPPFTDYEFHCAVTQYRTVYGIDNLFDSDVMTKARENPFLLRILFDVAKDNQLTAFTFESGVIFDAYLKLISRKTKAPSTAIRTINAIAKALYEQNIDQIEEDNIRSVLGLSINENLMDELFEYGILYRNEETIGNTSVGFYFQQLRDYVVAFNVARFSSMNEDDFQRHFAETVFPSVRGDAWMLFYRIAPIDQKLRIDQKFRTSASLYLKAYVDTIETNFPAIKSKFKPTGDHRVGIVGELLMPGHRIGYHGFRKITPEDHEIEFVPVASLTTEPGERRHNRIFRDVSSAKFTLQKCIFREGDDIARYVVENEVIPQLEPLVMNGLLNEKNNPEMLKEFIVGVVRDKRDIFKSLYENGSSDLPSKLILAEVSTCLLIARLNYHYEAEYLEAAMAAKRQRERSTEAITYSHTWTPADRALISSQVNEAISSGKYYEESELRTHTDLKELTRRITTTIRQLEAHDISTVHTHYQDIPNTDILDCKNVDLQVHRNYLINLHENYVKNFHSFVKTNFPTLSRLPKFQIEPHTLYMVIGQLETDQGGRYDRQLTLYYVEKDDSEKLVSVISESEITHSRERWSVTISGKEHKLQLIEYTSAKDYCDEDSGLYRSYFYEMPIRSFVYSSILRAIRNTDDKGILEAIVNGPPIAA